MFLALFSLYPFLAAALSAIVSWILLVSTSMNVVLTTLCVAFYMMIPTGSFDHWFSSMSHIVYFMFPKYLKKFETNIDKTFQLHEKKRPERALYLWHPHGMLSLAPIIHVVRKDFGKIVSVPIFHKIPVIRDGYHYLGCIPSEYSVMKNALEKESLSIIPGGTREMMSSRPGTMRLILKDRTGVFKLALETGTPIVPVLTFGEDELFPQLDMPILRSINLWLYSQWKIAIPFMSLTSVANWIHLAHSSLPPIQSYCGETIEVPKTDDPSMEQIQELRKKYRTSLEALFRDKAPRGMMLEVE